MVPVPCAPTAEFETISPAAGGIGNPLTISSRGFALASKTKHDKETTGNPNTSKSAPHGILLCVMLTVLARGHCGT